MKRVVVAEDDQEILSLVASSLAFRGYEVIPTRDGLEAWALIQAELPEAVVLDIEMPGLSGVEVCQRLRADPATRNMAVIFLTAHGEPQDRKAALDAGANEFLVKPFAPRELTARMDALLQAGGPAAGGGAAVGTGSASTGRGRRTGEGKVIALFGGKGGVGTSALAANLAVALAQTGASVCLFDLDLERPTADMLLDLVPAREGTVANLASEYGPQETDWDRLQGYLLGHASGVKLLAGPQTPVRAELVTAKHARAYLDLLRAQHAYVIVDLVAGYREATVEALEAADLVLVVITPDLAALKGVRALAGVLEQLGVSLDKLGLVVNHTTPMAGISVNDIKRAAALPILASIPYGGNEFLDAFNGGTPIVQRRPQHAVSVAIRKLAEAQMPAPERRATR
jgi:pilus assembly protein CpaE